MKNRHQLSALAASASAILLLSACSGSTPAQPNRDVAAGAGSIAQCVTDSAGGVAVEEKELVQLNLISHDAAAVNSLKARAAEVSSLQNSPYTYEITESISEASDVATKANAAISAGTNVPDIIGLDSTRFSTFMPSAKTEFFDFTDYLGDVASDRIESRDAVWSADGRLYGVESGYGLGAFFYNQAAFDELGIDPAELKTWDDVIRVGAEKAAPQGKALMGFASGSDGFLYALSQRGGGMFDAEGNVTIDTPEAVEALQMLVDGVEAGAFAPFAPADFYGAPNYAAMQNESVIGYAFPDWWLAYFMKPNLEDQAGEWRAQPQPRFDAGGYATGLASGHAWLVYKNGEVSEAAALLIKCGQATSEAQTQMFLESGYLPHNASAFGDLELQDFTDPFLGDQAVVPEVYEPASVDAPVVINNPSWGLAQQVLDKEISDVIAGRKTVEDGLSTAQRMIEEAIESSGGN